MADDTKEELFVRTLAGVEADHLQRVAEQFALDHLAAHVRPEVRRRLDWHRGRGDTVVVVSASPDAYVAVAARPARRRRHHRHPARGRRRRTD